MTRVAIYARYSDELQNPLSIDDQIRNCKDKADREGWSIVKVYSDPKISGFSLLLRPGIQRLMEDAREGKFDIVLAEGLDRISRDQEDTAAFFKRITFNGAKIVTLQEDVITSLHVGFKGTMNAIFLDDLKVKVKRGLKGRVESGRSGGGNCYGYDMVRNIDSRGELIRGERLINEAEAAVVQRIFRDYVAGKSPKSIAYALNKEQVSAPTAAKWAPTTIYGNWQRGSGILNNELYIGQRIWNKVSYPKSPDTGKKVARINPPEQWVRSEVPELRIIDQDLWDKVKARQLLTRTEHKKFWQHQRPRHLFSFLLKCGCCGGGMAKISQAHYGCSSARNKGDSVCGNLRAIRQDELETTVLGLLKDKLMDQKLLDVFCKEYTAHINRLRMEHNADISKYRAELAKLQGRQKRIINAVAEGFATPGMKEESNAIYEREKELAVILSNEKEAPVLLHPAMADRYQKEIDTLIKAMKDKTFGSEAIEIVRSLIEKVVLTPDPNGEGLLINLYGDLVGIAKIATGKSVFREEDEDAFRQVRLLTGLSPHEQDYVLQGKMVAGESSPLALPSINSSQPSRTGKGKKVPIAIMQDKMVGPEANPLTLLFCALGLRPPKHKPSRPKTYKRRGPACSVV